MDKQIILEKINCYDEEYLLNQFENNLDGVIAIGKFNIDEICILKKVFDKIIFVDEKIKDEDVYCVYINLLDATKKVLDYLIKCGHKNIGYIGIKKESIEEDGRQLMFRKYMNKHHLCREEDIYINYSTSEGGFKCMNEAISKGELPTAFFIASDSMAIGALKALHHHKIKVPEQVAIIGFNDIPTAEYTVPSLTTVRTYTEIMGKTALTLLLTTINEQQKEIGLKVEIPTKLIIRKSV